MCFSCLGADDPDSDSDGMQANFRATLAVASARVGSRLEANRFIIAFSDCSGERDPANFSFLYEVGFEREAGISDSVEGFNRTMFACNDVLILWLFRPIMKGYFVITPWCVRKGIDNAVFNIEFPIRAVSCLLQGRWADAGIVCSRFFINTILGVAGVYDFADHVWQIRECNEDTGQAFAAWGLSAGFYLYLPILGPTSLRDGIGTLFDYALDPLTYAPVPGIQSFATFNRASFRLDDYVKLVNSYSDPYQVLKTLWTIQRRVQINVDK